MNERNRGHITIYMDYIRKTPDKVFEIFSRLRIVTIVALYDADTNSVTYLGLSPYFKEVTEGQIVPHYIIKIIEDNKGEIESVELEK